MNEETEIDEPETEALLTPEITGISGKEVEEFMLKAANERAEDPTEMAANAYSMYGPFYKRAVPKLSKRSLRRILDYLIFYPLEQESIKCANEAEKGIMQLANFLIEAKFIMQMDIHVKNIDKYVEALETPLTTEEESAINEEISKLAQEVKNTGLTEDQFIDIVKENQKNFR